MLAKIRVAIVVLLVAGVAFAGYVGYRLFTEAAPTHEPEVSHAIGTTDDGWQRITYGGLDLEVPPEWSRLDTGGCEVPRERWGAQGQDPCGDAGLAFLEAATFDPAQGPGVHVAPASQSLPSGGFSGYVTRGDLVVEVADPDQAVVRRVLQSVTEAV